MKIRRQTQTAFGRIDALATIAAAMLICGFTTGVSARSFHSRGILTCMNNLKQLVRAWTHYAEDRSGTLPAADDGYEGREGWLRRGHWLELPAGDRDNVDTEGGSHPLSESPLWSYVDNATVFVCPDDYGLTRFESLADEAPVQRVRSYSMQSWMGGRPWSSGWKVFRNLADLTEPGPSNTIVFLEDRVETINDGYFVIDMTGNRSARIVSFPGVNHRSGLRGFNREVQCVISFADGRAAPQTWKDPRTTPEISETGPLLNISSPGNPDVYWLQQRATVRE